MRLRKTLAMIAPPSLVHVTRDGIRFLADEKAHESGLIVAFTDREGGSSAAPYDSLNLAARVGDDPDAVAANRNKVAAAAGFDVSRLALARQVHQADLIEVDRGHAGVLGEADGLIVREPGPVAAILTADCAPVVVAGDHTIGVLHAGWRGLVAGVIEAGLEVLEGANRAWIGPCIHACCYEVGPEVVDSFLARGLPVADLTHVDPAQAAAAILKREGVGDVAVATDCTHCGDAYFSFRRDGVTGRQGAFAGLIE